MLTIEMSKETEAALEGIARDAGQTREQFALAAILRGMEDREDASIAEQSLKDFYESGASAVPIAQVMKNLGLDH